MIGALRGKIWRKLEGAALVDCGGVGYLVTMSTQALGRLGTPGAEVTLEIHTHVREDQIALFGFADELEKEMFELLLSVSGVGPKMAINVLSGMAAPDLIAAIGGENLALLTKIPGVGKKTAERLLVELKGSVKRLGVVSASPRPIGGVRQELTSALLNLGYKPAQVETTAERLVKDHPDLGLEALVREALKALR
jgi:Holliday junction DNA helicase RuvA